MADAKEAARERVEQARDELVDLSHRIHAHPELGFEEERAAAWLGEALDGHGLRRSSAGVGDLPTAFAARAGSGPLHVVVCAEYDALPGIGHACGHNVIAATAVGAGLALAEVADDARAHRAGARHPGRGGRRRQDPAARAAAPSTASTLAMMVHPAPIDIAEMPIIAVQPVRRPLHRQGGPRLGLPRARHQRRRRPHRRPGRHRPAAPAHPAGDRVHGIVTHGGDAANIVPAHTEAEYIIRARDAGPTSRTCGTRVMRCFEAGALATGATLDVMPTATSPTPRCATTPTSPPLYRRNAEALGRTFPPIDRPGAGLDRHGQRVAGHAVDPPDHRHRLAPGVNHQPEFTAHCATPGRRPGRGRRRRRHGLDGHRLPPPTRPCASGCWPAPGRGSDPRPRCGCPGRAGGSDVSGERHRTGCRRERRRP